MAGKNKLSHYTRGIKFGCLSIVWRLTLRGAIQRYETDTTSFVNLSLIRDAYFMYFSDGCFRIEFQVKVTFPRAGPPEP